MNIYYDESIHEKYGFMILAYVICRSDPQKKLETILEKFNIDEFHSLVKMKGNSNAQSLRNKFRSYINTNCNWGIIVLPSKSRWKLVEELPDYFKGLIQTFKQDDAINIFFDEGLVKQTKLEQLVKDLPINSIKLCKSHIIKGVQLADLVAALCGVRLKEKINKSPKILTFGYEAGFDSPTKIDLGYELWASLRYSMYRDSEPIGDGDFEIHEFNTQGHGLFISDKCSLELRSAAMETFGTVYLGCIH